MARPTQGVNVDKLGIYSPAERSSGTERDAGEAGEKKKNRTMRQEAKGDERG